MSARILVVDDVLPNVKVLEAKLTAAYFSVLTATNGPDALEIAERESPDLILLDVMMPGMDGFEVCERLKANSALAHIPVVMITALDQPSDRLRGIEAGADDFLTKPANDLALFARVRSLVRVKIMIDELRLRDETFRELGIEADLFGGGAPAKPGGKVLIVDKRQAAAASIAETLTKALSVTCQTASSRDAALSIAQREAPDVYIVGRELDDTDGVRLCSEIRSLPGARHAAIVLIADDGDYPAIAAGLDVGASDYVVHPVDKNELVARVRSQLLRKRYAEQLRANMHTSMRLAVTDPLTSLYNRRYVESHLASLLRRASEVGTETSIIMLDIDHFKLVNDAHGHAAGDAILVEFARRSQEAIRGVDMIARLGGEEFLAIMPDTSPRDAGIVAERVRVAIADVPFSLGDDAPELGITVSIGVAGSKPGDRAVDSLIKRADDALYNSKKNGRNKVTQFDAA